MCRSVKSPRRRQVRKLLRDSLPLLCTAPRSTSRQNTYTRRLLYYWCKYQAASHIAQRPVLIGRVPSFCRSVCCRSVGNERILWKNGWLNRDAVWGGGSGGCKEPRVWWVSSCLLTGRGIFMGGEDGTTQCAVTYRENDWTDWVAVEVISGLGPLNVYLYQQADTMLCYHAVFVLCTCVRLRCYVSYV